MSISITLPLAKLLSDVAKKHGIDPVMFRRADGSFFFDDQNRDKLLEALTDELTATGLRADDEPNERGLNLEELINFVNRAAIKPKNKHL